MTTIERLDREITELEDRVVNARSIEAARSFHDRLDEARARRDELARSEPDAVAYQRGYQAGYHAGIRHREDHP